MKTNPISADVFFSGHDLGELELKDRTVVVVDVLRASTTIAAALESGAKELIPVASVESAMKISGGLTVDNVVRAGERNGRRIEGFHLGNSPVEFTAPAVKGKSIVYMTTNGTGAILRGKYAKNLSVGAFVNVGRVVESLIAAAGNFTIVCAGQDGAFSLEDAVCAGRILNRFLETTGGDVLLNDCAAAAVTLDKACGKAVHKLLKSTDHGRYLAGIGFSADLKFASEIDALPVLPVFQSNVIRKAS